MKNEYAIGLLVAQLLVVDSESEMLQSTAIDDVVSLCDVPRDTSRFVPSLN